MNKSPLTTILLLVLLASALVSVVLCLFYIPNVRELRKLQREAGAELQIINRNSGLLNALSLDLMEYSKKSPEIKPILESLTNNANKSSVAPAAGRPATK